MIRLSLLMELLRYNYQPHKTQYTLLATYGAYSFHLYILFAGDFLFGMATAEMISDSKRITFLPVLAKCLKQLTQYFTFLSVSFPTCLTAASLCFAQHIPTQRIRTQHIPLNTFHLTHSHLTHSTQHIPLNTFPLNTFHSKHSTQHIPLNTFHSTLPQPISLSLQSDFLYFT